MAVLTRNEIIKRIKSGKIKIEPFQKSSVGPGSIDLRLDKKFCVFKEIRDIYKVDEKANYKDITKIVTNGDYFVLMPGQTVHGITVEKLSLPDNLCGWIEGRSSLGRLGLMVHITAGFIQPGMSGKIVLEMNNAGPVPLAIHPGIKVCQIVLEETLGRARYKGRFRNQKTP